MLNVDDLAMIGGLIDLIDEVNILIALLFLEKTGLVVQVADVFLFPCLLVTVVLAFNE